MGNCCTGGSQADGSTERLGGSSSIITQKITNAEKTKILNLSDLELKTLPLDRLVQRVPDLRSLDASRNQLSSIGPSFGQLQKLRTLNLDSNQLSQMPIVQDIPTLETLTAAHNRLSSLPSEFGRCCCLRSINLSYNALSCLPARCFDGMQNTLRILDLTGNSLTDLPSSFFALSALQECMLAHNKLRHLSGSSSTGLKSLRKLVLSNNGLEKLPDDIFTATPLDQLDIDGNPLTWAALKDQPGYEEWRGRQKENIDKQMHSGLVVRPNS